MIMNRRGLIGLVASAVPVFAFLGNKKSFAPELDLEPPTPVTVAEPIRHSRAREFGMKQNEKGHDVFWYIVEYADGRKEERVW